MANIKKYIRGGLTFIALFIFILSPIKATPAKPESSEPATKLEEFYSKKGQLIVKDFIKIGEITGALSTYVTLTAVIINQPGIKTAKIKGIKIEITQINEYGKNKNTSFLDYEEIISLDKAIKYIIDIKDKWDKEEIEKEYTEVIFSTKDNYRIGFYQEKFIQSVFMESGNVKWIYAYKEDLTKFNNLIKKGIAILDSK